MNNLIVPRALMIAAKTFKDRPAVVGEILVALVTESEPKKLTDVQRYILAECRDELGDVQKRRAQAAERKRRFRERKGTAA